MIGPRPDFLDSPYFVDELNNWHLKPGAPKEVVEEFEEFMKDDDFDLESEKLKDNDSVEKSFRESTDEFLRMIKNGD